MTLQINHRLFLDQDEGTRQNKSHIFGIITSIDLLDFIVKNKQTTENGVSEEKNSTENLKQNGCHHAAKNKSEVAEQSEALH